MTARKSAKDIFPVPSLSTSTIIFLISSFFGSNPRALIATWNSVRRAESEAHREKKTPPPPRTHDCDQCSSSFFSLLLLSFFFFFLPWAPWHRCIQSHRCQTARRPPWSPASAPRSALVWGWSSCEEVVQDPAGMVSWHWLPGEAQGAKKKKRM